MEYQITIQAYCPTKEEVYTDRVTAETEALAVKAAEEFANKAQNLDPKLQLTFRLFTKGACEKEFKEATFTKWSQTRLCM